MGKARRRAVATARAAALPQYQALDREKREARQTMQQGRRANRQAYGALDRTLADIGQDYRGDYRRINNGLGQGMAGLGGMMNVATGGEHAVGAGGFGGIGASAVRGLAQQRSRGTEYTRSTRTQGAVEQKTNALNLLSAFEQQLKDIQNRRHDVAAQQGANVQALIPEYQQQAFDNRIQRRQLEMLEEEAAQGDELAAWYLEYLKRKYQRNRATEPSGVPAGTPQPHLQGWERTGW